MPFRDLTIRGRRATLLTALGASGIVVPAVASVGGPAPAPLPERSARAASVHAATRESPPIAHTGGFGEPTCEHCHWGEPLNDARGSLAVEGLASRFQPGSRHRITITLRRPGIALAGFELAARYEDGDSRGQQAGTLRAVDNRATVSTNDTTRVQYAHHTLQGTDLVAEGTGRWTVDWTAPAAPLGAIVLHVVANGADQNDSPTGDFVYARRVTATTAEK